MAVMDGRYGPYVKWGKVNATLPKGTDPAEVTPELAVQLIAEKQAKSGKKAPAKKSAKASGKGATAKGASGKKASSSKKAAKPKTSGKKAPPDAAE
jgi:DNA topoisomerase-1